MLKIAATITSSSLTTAPTSLRLLDIPAMLAYSHKLKKRIKASRDTPINNYLDFTRFH
jgi:hypothetical protein